MFNIEFYSKEGEDHSELYIYLEELKSRSAFSKDARINFNSIATHINLLKNNGTNLPTTFVKKLNKAIYELRAIRNRILFFIYCDNTYVLLHMFIKKTQKTPKKEIEKAVREMNDYIRRKNNV